MVLNCLWLYFIKSPAVAVSVSGYVFYLFVEMLPLVVFYILASINPFFYVEFVWEFKTHFSYPLNMQGITS